MIEGSWSGMKKYLEQEMLCEALRGRVTYDLTRFRPAGDEGAVFTVSLDGQPVKRFGFHLAAKAMRDQGFDIRHAWDISFEQRDEYTDDEFAEALKTYRNQPIGTSVDSDNPIIRMFAILDRRVGKRRLERLKDEAAQQPGWLKPLYLARLQAEGITIR
jgi:hypothetical protein